MQRVRSNGETLLTPALLLWAADNLQLENHVGEAIPLYDDSIQAAASAATTLAGVDELPAPGVTVKVTSPNLQGTRTAITSEAGDYLLPLLPPGEYTVTFERS